MANEKWQMKNGSQPKVAIVHDWLVGGGAERVVEELHHMFPGAPVYTSYATKEWQEKLDGKVVTGFLQKWPFGSLRKYVGLLRIWWFSHLDFSGYDLVITSSGNGEAIGVKVPDGTKLVCYCHTPTHYLWRHYDQYVREPGFRFGSFGLRLLLKPLRKWDFKAAQRPDFFIANSSHIKHDIKKYYGRNAVVIHPPIDIKAFAKADNKHRHGFMTVGRQVPQKKTDIIVAACTNLNLPLRVVGRGPEHKNLVSLGGGTIDFDDNASREAVIDYVSNAEAFIFAALDDFGITPVEAMAAGTPVIAYKAGGALDYVREGKTGEFFDKQTVVSLSEVLQSFDPKKYNHADIKKEAQKFSVQNFHEQMRSFLNKVGD